jgi:subtilisin family serine protease
MRHLSPAFMAVVTALVLGAADADTPIELFDQASADAMGAAGPRAAGFTGKGVTVAVVDSGCDASHPDLADHVVPSERAERSVPLRLKWERLAA